MNFSALQRNGQGTLVEQIAERIRESILSGYLSPGEKLPTLPELEQQFGVGIVTVRRAMETLAREGLVCKKTRIGTVVQRREFWNRHDDRQTDETWAAGMSALIVGSPAMFPDYPGGARVSMLAQSFEAAVCGGGGGCTYALVQSAEDLNTVAERMAAHNAVLCLPLPEELADGVIRLAQNRYLPLVTCDYAGGYRTDDVSVDWDYVTQEAMRYLIRLGHRRIAMASYTGIGAGPGEMDWATRRERMFLETAQREGLDLTPMDLFQETHRWTDLSDPGVIRAGERLTSRIFASPRRYTAILAVNDYISVGLVREAARQGLVPPADFSIIGFDNFPAAAQLGLDTIVPPSATDGRCAASLLGERFRSPGRPSLTRMVNRPLYLKRQSTAAPQLEERPGR